MLPPLEIYTMLVICIVFLATLTRSTFGFGDALVGMPLLAMIGEVDRAAPLIALTSATIAGVIILRDWKSVKWKSAVRLIAAACLGIPLGLVYLARVEPVIVKSLLAVVVIGFSIVGLIGRSPLVLQSDKSIYLFGFCAGVLGGAYNTHGPPLVLYGSMRRWTAEQFRATLQGYFFPTSLAIILGHSLTDRCTPLVLGYFLISVPGILAAVVIGRWLNLRVRQHNFQRLVYLLLLIVGTSLLVTCFV